MTQFCRSDTYDGSSHIGRRCTRASTSIIRGSVTSVTPDMIRIELGAEIDGPGESLTLILNHDSRSAGFESLTTSSESA
jgi:hypothetical protein